MVPSTGMHPPPGKLAAFGLGKLDPEEHAEVERHVAACNSCCRALEAVPDDTLLGRMQAINAATNFLPTLTDPTAQAAADGIPPELVDHPRYAIVRLMGAGGMGVVYQAEHRLMDRAVALKVVGRRLTSNPTAVERFRLEVKAAARLSHPNIVTVHDAEQAGDLHFLVMECVDGVSLALQVEKRGPLMPHHAANFARQAALGLQHAWEQGMVHRDIKPQNLMLTRKGQIKILDFGLARLYREASTGERPGVSTSSGGGITLDGVVLGSPDYIAPEQATDPRQADIRADIYSLGCTLYFLLAGQAPFARGSISQKLTSHQEQAPRPLMELRSDVPPELTAIVERMMAKDPAARQQTPAEVAEALAPFARAAIGQGVPTVPESSGPEALLVSDSGSTAGKRAALLSAGGIAAIAVGLLAAWFWNNPSPAAKPFRAPSVLLVIPPRGFFFPEVGPLRNELDKGGVQWRVASTTLEPCQPDAYSPPTPVQPDLLISQVRVADYDAIYFCGGKGTEVFAAGGDSATEVQRLLKDALAAKCTVAAMSLGVVVLADADVLKQRRAACYPYGNPKGLYARRIKARGVICSEEAVVEDGPFLTGRAPEDVQAFTRRLLGRLGVEPRPPPASSATDP